MPVKNYPIRRGLVLAFSLLVAVAPKVDAQSSGTVLGTVRDLLGEPIADARVVLTGTDDGASREVQTTAFGAFEFSGLAGGRLYTIEAMASGFAVTRVAVAALTAGERRQVDLGLPVAGVTDRVVVVSEGAIGLAATPELGGHIDQAHVDRLPMNGRDLVAVAYLVPGAAPARGFYNLAPRLTINGASSLSTNYMVDGFDNTDLFLGGPKIPVTLGSTADLRVLVNGYSAEYGRTGNGVFLVTSRSGSNRSSATAFWMWRPGAVLDAPNFFAPRDAAGRVIDDNFRRHQAGASFGGALRPSRLFYFVDTEVTRERQDAILTSPLSVGLAPTAYRGQTWMGKLDARWSDTQSSSVRYHGSDSTHDGDVGFVGGLTLPSAGLEVNYRNHYSSVLHRTVRGSSLHEVGVQVGQLRADWRSPGESPRVVVTDRGASVATIGSVSDSFLWTETDVHARNVFSTLVGHHSLKAGGDLVRGAFEIVSGPGARGAYVVDLQGQAVTRSGSYLAIGDLPRDVTVLSYSQSFVNPVVRRPQTLVGLFAEDTVRVTSDLTLSLGVRWDFDSVTSTPIGDADLNNLAPRIGFGWVPGGHTRHQVRGGYGVFYERIPFAVSSDTTFNSPEGGAVSVTFAPGTPFAPPAFPSTLPRDTFARLPISELPPRNVQVFDPALASPSTRQFSLGYAFSIDDDWAVGVDIVSSRGRNVIRRVDTNAPKSILPGLVRSTAEADATRPIAPVAGGVRLVEQDESTGRSRFDGLYVTVRRRVRNGTAIDLAYTLSRAENDTDDINFRPVDSRRPDAEFGPSLNDRRHVLAVNGLVRVPGVFDVVPVLFLSSGQPLNITTGRDDNGDTIFNDRPAGVARNSERTDGFAQLDLGLVREFGVGRARLQLRADMFNVLDRVNFSGFFNYGASGVRPDESGTLTFQPTAAGPARQVQVAARVSF